MKKYMKLLFGIMIVFLCMGAGEKNVNGAELPITAEHFSAEWLREVLSSTTYDIDGNGALSSEEINKIKQLEYTVRDGQIINNMDGIEKLPALEFVKLNALKAEELQMNIGDLDTLQLQDAQIANLKVVSKGLKTLLLFGKGYASTVEISACNKIETFVCNSDDEYDGETMALASLNASDCTSLKKIACYSSSMSAINISRCSKLEELYCPSNNLTKLDISDCKKLGWLNCSDNQLKKLDISKNINLLILECRNNSIKKLDLKKCKDIKRVYCANNQLNSLDLSRNKKLEWVSFTNNKIKSLKLPNSGFLHRKGDNEGGMDDVYSADIYSSFAKNKIIQVDISNCKNLKKLNKSDIKRFLSGDYVRRKRTDCGQNHLGLIYYGEDDKIKKRSIKKLIISKSLQKNDRKWIEKQEKKYKVKVVVR